MPNTAIELLKTSRFFPLFLTQFLGALNDNIFKNALVVLLVFDATITQGIASEKLVTLAAGLFILPFFLFSALAGELADAFEKSRIIRIIKLLEILIMLLGAAGFLFGNVFFLFVVLFLMGTHSAFFGPLKYSILPVHLHNHELLPANAWVEASTFIAILLGTITGGLAIRIESIGHLVVSALVVAVAVAGYLASRAIPKAEAVNPHFAFRISFGVETIRLLKASKKVPALFPTMAMISWFWFVGAVFLSQFPNLVKVELGGNEQVVTLFLTMFSVGIALGACLCSVLVKTVASRRIWVIVGALGLSVAMVDLVVAIRSVAALHPEQLLNLSGFFEMYGAQAWRISGDILLTSCFGGLFTVPLYTLMQLLAPEAERSRMVASNNVLNALFMVVSAVVCLVFQTIGLKVTDILLITAFANIASVYVAGRSLQRK